MGRPQLFDEVKRGEYVVLLRAGVGRHAAAKTLGVGVRTVQQWRQRDEEFRQSCEDAEAEVNEPVELALYQAAIRGEPWAVKMWLANRDKNRWQDENKVKVDVKVEGEVAISAAELMRDVTGLAAELGRRRVEMERAGVVPAGELSAGTDVIDAEVVD